MVPHQPEHWPERVILNINWPFDTGMPLSQIGLPQAFLSKACPAGFVTFSTGLETAAPKCNVSQRRGAGANP